TNPYLLFDSVDELVLENRVPENNGEIERAQANIVKAIGKGLLKTISKMGISTVQSYCGAQIFEAVGLERELVDRFFTGTASRIGGIGLDVLAQETIERHAQAHGPWGQGHKEELPPVGGVYAWRREGELHMWNPETIALLQHAVRAGDDAQDRYDAYAKAINEDATKRATLPGLLKIRPGLEPIALEEVQPAQEIVRRFATGAMS